MNPKALCPLCWKKVKSFAWVGWSKANALKAMLAGMLTLEVVYALTGVPKVHATKGRIVPMPTQVAIVRNDDRRDGTERKRLSSPKEQQ